MIEYKTKDVQKGDVLYLEVECDDIVCRQRFYVLVEVLDVRGTRAEVSPIAGDRSCVWIESKLLRERRHVEVN